MATKNKYSDIDLSKYGQGYQASASVNAAEAQKNAAENAVKNYGDFKYSNQSAYDNAMNAYLNRGEFKYDLNSDALYQQYKDQYSTLGKMAMMDTMGQAAAMTGGYGNSYATTAGNQAYQGYLQNLNDVIPELYQLALEKYQVEGDQLFNNYNMLSQDRATERSEWGDKYNQLVDDRNYYADAYTDVYNRDYTTWNDNRLYDTDQYWNEYNTGYKADRDAIADEQWQTEYDESVRQYNASLWEERRQFNAAQKAKDNSGDDDKFITYDYSRMDDNGNSIFYYDGKEYTFERGINPYTNTKNPDIKYGTWESGYQPNNIGGKKLKEQTEYEVYVNGNRQKVWSYDGGKTLWAWDGTRNEYVDITSKKNELKKEKTNDKPKYTPSQKVSTKELTY